MKKKLVSLLLALALVLAAVFTLVACGDKLDDSAAIAAIEAGQKMSEEELIAAAKAETGDFVAYGNTSRITTAMDNFIAAYGERIGLTKGNAQKKDDSEIYTLLTAEQTAPDKSKNASMVLIQDSATLMQYRSNSKMLKNYVPKGMDKLVDEANLLPLAHQFINKLFMYNTAGDTTAKFTNVWQLTDASYKGKIFFKSPKDEQVNMNFLIMLTSDTWAGKLKSAYVELKGVEATDVGAGKTYENYGYKWIAEFIANCNFSITSDTTIAGQLSKESNAGKMGLFVLSKLRDASVYSENLAVSAWDKDANDKYVTINPFAGFMYSIYAQLATFGPRPYTAMLFINYLMTEDGFTPWKSLGGYSANSSVPVYSGSLSTPVVAKVNGVGDAVEILLDNNKRPMYKTTETIKVTEDGKEKTYAVYEYLTEVEADKEYTPTGEKINGNAKVKVDGKDTTLSAKNKVLKGDKVQDSELSFWRQTLVIEDGTYILSVKAKVLDWINKQLPSK